MTENSPTKFNKESIQPPGMEGRFPNQPPPRPGMPPRPPGGMPLRPGMMRPPMRGAPPDLGPPNGRMPGGRPPPLGPPPFRPGGPFQNYPGFQQPGGFPPHFSQHPSRPGAPTNTTLPKPPIFDKDGQPWLEACSASGKVYYFNARTRETRWDRPESFEEAEAKKHSVKDEENEENKEQPENNDGAEIPAEANEEQPDSEMIDMQEQAKNSDDPMEVQNEEIKAEASSHSEPTDESSNNVERKENDEYYSPYLDETDSPARSPLNVDQLPPVVITKKNSSEDGEDEDMEKKIEEVGEDENKDGPIQETSADNSLKSEESVMETPAKQIPQMQPFNAQGMPPGLPMPFAMHPGMMRPPPGLPPPGFPGFPPRMPPGLGQPRFPPFPGFRIPPPDFVPKTIGDWTEHRLPDGRLYYYNNRTKESKWDKPPEFNVPKDDGVDLKEKNSSEKPGDEKFKEGADETVKGIKDEKKTEDANPAKPVASRPIVGTGWHLVWTGDGKVFFFKPSSKTSIWERPPELIDNEQVDEILKQGPKGKAATPDVEKVQPIVNKVVPDKKPAKEEKNVKVENHEPEVKKKKVEPEPGSIGALPVVSGNESVQNGSRRAPDKVKEVEVRKAIIPLDERMTMFTNLLKEKEVSAFSTWEKELHKILFDPRYLLLTMKERKQCFEKYVKVRAVEERKERIQKLKERKEDFKKLLEEVIYSASDFASKNSKDTRFREIEKMKDREALFNEYMTDFRKHEKERLKAREDRLRKSFFELLGELNNLDETSQWKKVKSSIESDRRYELVGSSSKREQFFYDYIQEMEGNKEENVEPVSPASPAPPPPDEDEEEPMRPPSPDGDPDSQEKAERINASIRKREEEVRAQKEMYEKDREKERGIHMYEKAVQHFRALLADMVKDTQYTWKETRRSLRKDPRWSALDVLSKNEKEDLFEEHIREIRDKRKKSFRKLLDESDVSLDAEWRDVRRKIKDDPRYAKFGTSELREEEFEVYLKEKVTAARTDFRELLRECKLITYKSKRTAEENPNHIKDITAILKKDKRYLMMSSLTSERERLITNYIDELHKRGPPPPPTATNPSARYKKD